MTKVRHALSLLRWSRPQDHGETRSQTPWIPARCSTTPLVEKLQRRLGGALFDNPGTFLATEAVSILAAVYAAGIGPGAYRLDGRLLIASALPSAAYPRGGICIGRVFLTGPEPSAAVVRHEKRHMDQWNRYGLAMPLLYAMSGSDPHRNWFEIEAGLQDGGYIPGSGDSAGYHV